MHTALVRLGAGGGVRSAWRPGGQRGGGDCGASIPSDGGDRQSLGP